MSMSRQQHHHRSSHVQISYINPDTRPLPRGWETGFDSSSQTWYYVNTRTNPHLTQWHHPAGPPPEGQLHRPAHTHSSSHSSSHAQPPPRSPSYLSAHFRAQEIEHRQHAAQLTYGGSHGDHRDSHSGHSQALYLPGSSHGDRGSRGHHEGSSHSQSHAVYSSHGGHHDGRSSGHGQGHSQDLIYYRGSHEGSSGGHSRRGEMQIYGHSGYSGHLLTSDVADEMPEETSHHVYESHRGSGHKSSGYSSSGSGRSRRSDF